MTVVFGDLAQDAPAATTLVDLYTCPGGYRATVKMSVANRGGATAFRVALAPGGSADHVRQYKAYDEPLDANAAVSSESFTLNAGDVVRVRSTSGNVSFTLNGYRETV